MTKYGTEPLLVDLKLGEPYSKLVRYQELFAQTAGVKWGIDGERIIPLPGTTGAIEAVRNHVLKRVGCQPRLLTVSPEYWRARESFKALGFKITEIPTDESGFAIDEGRVIASASSHMPDLLYLSLPNNPTGALFDASCIIRAIPEQTAVLIDLTLPSTGRPGTEVMTMLYTDVKDRPGVFFAGSTSKSHRTAEYRIGWLVCANAVDAAELRQENRNVVSVQAIEEGLRQLNAPVLVAKEIHKSFVHLRQAECDGLVDIVRPKVCAEACYVLVHVRMDLRMARECLIARRIHVMWGHEIGLAEGFVRLETSVPDNIAVFVEALRSVATA